MGKSEVKSRKGGRKGGIGDGFDGKDGGGDRRRGNPSAACLPGRWAQEPGAEWPLLDINLEAAEETARDNGGWGGYAHRSGCDG